MEINNEEHKLYDLAEHINSFFSNHPIELIIIEQGNARRIKDVDKMSVHFEKSRRIFELNLRVLESCFPEMLYLTFKCVKGNQFVSEVIGKMSGDKYDKHLMKAKMYRLLEAILFTNFGEDVWSTTWERYKVFVFEGEKYFLPHYNEIMATAYNKLKVSINGDVEKHLNIKFEL